MEHYPEFVLTRKRDRKKLFYKYVSKNLRKKLSKNFKEILKIWTDPKSEYSYTLNKKQ